MSTTRATIAILLEVDVDPNTTSVDDAAREALAIGQACAMRVGGVVRVVDFSATVILASRAGVYAALEAASARVTA